MTRKAKRLQFQFWLDTSRADQKQLSQDITELKKRRKFAKAVRTGLRLFISLSRGDTSVLQAEFPMLFEEIKGSGKSKASSEYELLIQKIDALHRTASSGSQSPPISPPTPRRATLEDDSELTMTKTKADGRQIALNFVNSLSAVSGVSFGKIEPSEPRQIDMGTLPVPTFEDDDNDLLI